MKTFEVCFEPDRNLKMKKRQLISLCHLLKTTESREGRTCATLLTRGIFSAAFSSACALVCRDAGRDEGEELRDKESGREIYEVNIRILSEELSVCAGELETLLLRWDEGRLPGLLPSSREGAGEGLSGTRSCTANRKNKHSQGGHYMTHSFQQHTDRHTSVHAFFFSFFFFETPSPHPFFCILSLLSFPGYCLTDCSLQCRTKARITHHPAPSTFPQWLMRDVHDTMRERRRGLP